MKGLCHPDLLKPMPNVAAWLKHSHAAHSIVCEAYPADLPERQRVRAIAMENVVVQLDHLRTHPSVAAAIARGQIALHGWFVDIHSGSILALDGQEGHFTPVRDDAPLPVALPHAARLAAHYTLKRSA